MLVGDIIMEVLGSEPPSAGLALGLEPLGAGLALGSEPPSIRVCLDQTFQDAGGRLMDVVDEDPAWIWIPPGGQFCKRISGIVVLLGDMMQLDPSELALELVHLLAVCHHERDFAGGFLHDLVDDQL